MRGILKVFLSIVISLLLLSCSSAPTNLQIDQAVRNHIETHRELFHDLIAVNKISVLEVGTPGTADLAASGSQDTYWPVKVTVDYTKKDSDLPNFLNKILDKKKVKRESKTTTFKIWRDGLKQWHAVE
jgi:hypothetical protein